MTTRDRLVGVWVAVICLAYPQVQVGRVGTQFGTERGRGLAGQAGQLDGAFLDRMGARSHDDDGLVGGAAA